MHVPHEDICFNTKKRFDELRHICRVCRLGFYIEGWGRWPNAPGFVGLDLLTFPYRNPPLLLTIRRSQYFVFKYWSFNNVRLQLAIYIYWMGIEKSTLGTATRSRDDQWRWSSVLGKPQYISEHNNCKNWYYVRIVHALVTWLPEVSGNIWYLVLYWSWAIDSWLQRVPYACNNFASGNSAEDKNKVRIYGNNAAWSTGSVHGLPCRRSSRSSQ